MADSVYARLSDVFSVPQLPTQLAFVQPTSSALDEVYYRNLDVAPRTDTHSLAGSIELVSYKELKFEVFGTGFHLVLNPGQATSTGRTIIPLGFSYSIGIGRYIPDFRQLQLPTDALGLFNLLLRMTGVTDAQLLNRMLQLFEPGATPQGILENFRVKAMAEFGTANGLMLGAPLPSDTTLAVEQVQRAFDATTAAINPLALPEALFQLYVFTGTPQQALDNMQQLLVRVLGPNWQQLLRDLFVPQVRAQLQVSAGVQIPRDLLLPMVRNSNGAYIVDTDVNHYATLVFAQGTLQFSTQGGFGYNLEVAASLERAQLGATGLQVEFSKAKLDLSDVTNIAEADADGRPKDFKGVYASEVNVFLPDGWTSEPGSVQLAATDVLIGTGGLSGTFGVKSGATSTLPNGILIKARLFQDVLVDFQSFVLTFKRNEVVSSSIEGFFTVEGLKQPDGSSASFPFALSFSPDGYRLAFNSALNPITIRLGAVGFIKLTRLAIGYDLGQWYIEVAATVELNQSLPFVGKVLPRQINVHRLLLSTNFNKTELDAQPIWADGTDVRGTLTEGASIAMALNKTISDALRLDLFRLSVAREENTVKALATVNARLKLTSDSETSPEPASPDLPRGFLARINNVGVYAQFEFSDTNEGGNLGPTDISLGFKLPDTVAITINAEAVSGSGQLTILNNGERYEGALALSFRNGIKVSAFAILLDKLPNGDPGPSLLVLVLASGFTPIQLGLGFTLNGVGGLLGLQRTVNLSVLRTKLLDRSLDHLLFSPTPGSNTPETLAVLDAAFPPDRNRYVFGLLAKIGWGAPRTLVTLDVGLIVELPAPVRLVLLGSLKATFPTEEGRVLNLQADFLGFVDFGLQQASFDALLVRSRFIGSELTGSLALRLYWGSQPLFLLSAGGFHPAFQPPARANLPSAVRLSLALANSADFQLRLSSYLAVTSNTVQFGSRVDLFVDLPAGFSLSGHLGFDALFQVAPFHVEARFAAGVSIRRGSRAILSLALQLALSGPGPWHLTGEGSFKALFVRVRFRIDRRFGGSAPAEVLPATDVRALLQEALQAPGNWQPVLPATLTGGNVVLRAEPEAGRLLVDAKGTLTMRQQVAPFGLRLERYGAARPTNGQLFRLLDVVLGPDINDPLAVRVPASELGDIRDFFAPAQYRQMSDAQRLSAPAFELLSSGLQLTGLDALAGDGVPQTRTTEYDFQVLANLAAQDAGARPAADDDTAGRLPGDADPALDTGFSSSPGALDPLPLATLAGLARHGAVGKARQSYEQRRPSHQAPPQVYWDEDSYLVVRTTDLSPYRPEPFASQALAAAWLQEQVALTPQLADQLQLVPAYQLDLA